MGKHADTQTDENSEYAEAVAKYEILYETSLAIYIHNLIKKMII